MLTLFLQSIAWFVLLFVLQIFVFNRIQLGGYATPLPYIYLLLTLPRSAPRYLGILLGFALGLSIDVFSNTIGVAAAATTLTGFLAPMLLPLFAPEDKLNEPFAPSARSMGWSAFARYAFTLSLLQCASCFSLEAFGFLDVVHLLLTMASSSIFTFGVLLAIERIRSATKAP